MGAAMRTLILLRHAKAERDAESGQDFDRALTDRGWADARLIGRVLADAGFVPDRARVSAARRAAQTWEAVATAFPLIEAAVLPELFHAGPERLMAEIEGASQDGETLLVVAHNPGLHTLALRWARASRARKRRGSRPVSPRAPRPCSARTARRRPRWRPSSRPARLAAAPTADERPPGRGRGRPEAARA
jgi:phosphohistidine phosphatase